MPSRLLPLFPLPVVVFPRTPLPLHIFEDRYKEMVGGAMRDNSEFGIVLARDGGIVNTGCTVTVEKLVQIYPDGRMDVLTRGQRRFEILSLNEEKDYLQAEVNYFDDEDAGDPAPELRLEALEHYQTLMQLPSTDPRPDADLEDRQLSFQLAHHLPDLDFLSLLLRRRSETERLRQLSHYLAQYIPRQRIVERMKELAPTNGHGGRPAGL